jgi:hypothetical protein
LVRTAATVGEDSSDSDPELPPLPADTLEAKLVVVERCSFMFQGDIGGYDDDASTKASKNALSETNEERHDLPGRTERRTAATLHGHAAFRMWQEKGEQKHSRARTQPRTHGSSVVHTWQ